MCCLPSKLAFGCANWSSETCPSLQLQLLLSSWKGKAAGYECLHMLLTLASKLLLEECSKCSSSSAIFFLSSCYFSSLISQTEATWKIFAAIKLSWKSKLKQKLSSPPSISSNFCSHGIHYVLWKMGGKSTSLPYPMWKESFEVLMKQKLL